MLNFTSFLAESDDERNVYAPGIASPVGKIVFMSTLKKNRTGGYIYWLHVDSLLTSDEKRKLSRANVVLVPDVGYTAYLGAPVKWTAPNGVLVVYVRGQRRSGEAEKTGAGTAGTYHDFNSEDEFIIPATQNDGPGRRALRAWAQQFMGSSVTAKMQARQMVRPGD